MVLPLGMARRKVTDRRKVMGHLRVMRRLQGTVSQDKPQPDIPATRLITDMDRITRRLLRVLRRPNTNAPISA